MAWREFRSSRLIHCSPQRAFDFVADHRNVRRVLEGVTRWRPLDSRDTGEGAAFDVEMKTLGLPLDNVLVLDDWEPGRKIGWRSRSGLIRQRGEWDFDPEDGAVRVTLRIAYEPPGAALGNLLAGRVDGVVRNRLRQALQTMAAILEQGAG